MAGPHEFCNHVIATLYKLEYANKGWIFPASTEITCMWNKSTKENVEPSKTSDLFKTKSHETK